MQVHHDRLTQDRDRTRQRGAVAEISGIARETRPCAVALGMFDGMHSGHRALLRETVRLARERGLVSVAYTFVNHPRSVFAQAPLPLMSAEERERAMREMGVERVDMVRFTESLARMEPRAFVEMLLRLYDMRVAVAGYDFTFGYRGAGNIETLARLGEELGFQVRRMEPVLYKGEKVSSTRLRALIEAGDDRQVAEMTR